MKLKNFFLIILPVAAQIVLPTNLSLRATPATPMPNSTAVITASLSGSNTIGANFNWSLNNVRQPDGSGADKNTFSFPTGNLGTVYTAAVTVTTPAGETLRDSLSLTASDADLTWSAASEAPADYEGKVLPSVGTKIIASALPIMFAPGLKTQLSANNLNYSWFLNGVFDAKNSGVGRHIYKFILNNPSTLKVKIANSQNTAVVEKSIDIRTVSPQILTFLANADGKVVYKSALNTISAGQDQKLDFVAMPYFFNLLPQQLNWSWFIDNRATNGQPNIPWLASLQIPKNIEMPSSLQVMVAALNPYSNAENAQNLININIK